jgi:hypothetical protein
VTQKKLSIIKKGNNKVVQVKAITPTLRHALNLLPRLHPLQRQQKLLPKIMYGKIGRYAHQAVNNTAQPNLAN